MSDTDTLEREEKKEKEEKHCGCNDAPEYTIRFDANGKLLVFDRDDEEVKGEKFDFPQEATSIKDIKTISIVQATGSHYLIIILGGTPYKFNLPH